MEKWVNVVVETDLGYGYVLYYYRLFNGEYKSSSNKTIKGNSRNVLPKYMQEAMALLDLNNEIDGVGKRFDHPTWDTEKHRPTTQQTYKIKRK